MTVTEKINGLLNITESYKAPERLLKILLNPTERNELFLASLEAFSYKLDYDWFHEYYEAEHADRKVHKQDFTPIEVAQLLTELVPKKGMYFEPCAGTGGICIAHWNKRRGGYHPLLYKPSDFLCVLEELSDRSIPFLIFNMAIRGVNSVIVHCDVLTRECYGVFFVQNDKNDPLAFSSVNVMPYSAQVEEAFNVHFTEKKYPKHVESPKEMIGL